MPPSRAEERLSSFDDMTLLYQRFLRLMGLLSFEGRDLSYMGSRLLLAYCLTSMTIYWSMFVFYAINESEVTTVDSIIEIVAACGMSLRYYVLARRRWEVTNLLDESRAIWDDFCDEDARRAVRRFERKIRLVFIFLLGSTVLGNITYSLTAIGLTLRAALQNGTQTRYLPCKWYTANGPNLWPGYKITFSLQVLVVQNACAITSTVDSTGPLLIMLGAGYFRALRNRLSRITEQSSADYELAACLRMHQRILDFCSRIRRITRTLFMVQLLGTVYNLSLAGIKLVGTDPNGYKYVPIALFQLGQLFICQWAPDYLIDESVAISTAAFDVSAVCMQRQLGKALILIITRSQRPVQMSAAGFVDLSLESFGSMVTSAVSFFTVLRNFNV